MIDSDAEDFNVIEKATPYDEIITLKNILAGVGRGSYLNDYKMQKMRL